MSIVARGFGRSSSGQGSQVVTVDNLQLQLTSPVYNPVVSTLGRIIDLPQNLAVVQTNTLSLEIELDFSKFSVIQNSPDYRIEISS